MIIKKLNKENAIILCGHGSRDSDYKNEMLDLKIKLEKNIQYDVFNCFIEINEPSIEDCLDEIIHKYKKIFFFPLLLFDGKHMIRDVKKKVNNFSQKFEKQIHIVTKLSLLKEVLPNIKDVITNSQKKEYDTLITSCSFSKNKTVFNQLRNYTYKLSSSLNIQNKIFHFVGDEEVVLSQLKKLRIKNIILHPIFFFNGYLFKKNIRYFEKYFKTMQIFPIAHYDPIIQIISDKLIRNI